MRGIKTSATILVVRRLSKKGKRSKIKYRNSETMKLFAKGAICNATAGCMFPVTWKPQRAFCLIRICHSYTWFLRFVVNQHIKNQILLWTLVLYHYREKKIQQASYKNKRSADLLSSNDPKPFGFILVAVMHEVCKE